MKSFSAFVVAAVLFTTTFGMHVCNPPAAASHAARAAKEMAERKDP